jgi:hypothetical protein
VKLRCESRGLHFYDRVTGYHVLLDDNRYRKNCGAVRLRSSASPDQRLRPRLRVLLCAEVNAPLGVRRLLRWCKELDALGTLEVAFGGGEPTLYRERRSSARRSGRRPSWGSRSPHTAIT